MAKEETAQVTEESKAYLEEVKKGKPRKFAMICKGTSVVSLVIYKKGSVEKRKKEAKEAGKGQFYFGVVDGKGVDVRFVLARADGFESEPVKNSVLKGFLEESAGVKCKPHFEIVDASPLVLDEDDPLVARFVRLQETALMACTTYPDRAAELNALCQQIGSHLDQDQSDPANAKLDELESLLGGLGAGAALQPLEASTPQMPTSADAAAQFAARLKVLLPAIKAAVGTPPGEEAKMRASESGVFARKQDFVQANLLLDQAEAALKKSSPDAPPPKIVDNSAIEFNKRLKALLPAIKAVAGTAPGDEAKLRASEAGVFARKLDFAPANALLDRVEALLSTPISEQPAVDWKSAKAAWQDASDTIDSQITKLQSVLKQSEDKELVEIAEFGLNALTGDFKVPLMAAIRDIDGSDGEARSKAARKALTVVKGFREHIGSSEQVSAVDNNPFGVELTIRTELFGAFAILENALEQMSMK